MQPQERRHYPRVSLTHVTVEVYDSAGMLDQPELCFIINVSENGMLFKSDQKKVDYKSPKRVRLTFTLSENSIVVRCDAIIKHTQETDFAVYVGVQFKNLLPSDQQSIHEFIQKSLGKKEK